MEGWESSVGVSCPIADNIQLDHRILEPWGSLVVATSDHCIVKHRLHVWGQAISCSDLGPGWHPDLFNCRRYWHCLNSDSEPEHLLCEDDSHGEPMMWNLAYDGCDYKANTDCGERPICDECNDNCVTNPPGPIDDCGHDIGTFQY